MIEPGSFIMRHQVRSDHQFGPVSGAFFDPAEASSAKRTDLSHGWRLRSLKNQLSGHPEVAHRKQHVQPRGVFLQSLEANLGEPELLLDHAERMLGLGADAGLELLQFVNQLLASTVLVQRAALAWPHGHMPIDIEVFGFIALGNPSPLKNP